MSIYKKSLFTIFNQFTLQVLLALWLFFSYVPTVSFWYEVERVEATRPISVEGSNIPLIVDRNIKRDFKGSWQVIVRKQGEEGFYNYCVAGSTLDYSKDNTLPPPDELNLTWWAYGKYNKCRGEDLTTGIYYIKTCHTIHIPIFLDRSGCINSRSFEVVSKDMIESHRIIGILPDEQDLP